MEVSGPETAVRGPRDPVPVSRTYGLALRIPPAMREQTIREPLADTLGSPLCAPQAGVDLRRQVT
ncbi:hypothetical protein RxyAA322_14740 [Rubrobacter xylanophilus]|uniref:Uncharacterized protein n=1 Tax=Rubrobacter xylanophilus TaxID=49319 RepID=A0A510HI01_9ACTN|nr:hypothetical protein RxyAA322_14740 [Rubrobacter xylanophilus]